MTAGELIPGKVSPCGHGVGRDNGSSTELLSLGLLSEGAEILPGCQEGLGGDSGAAHLLAVSLLAHIPLDPLPGAMSGVQDRSWPGSFSKESNFLFKPSNPKPCSLFSLAHHSEVMSFPAALHSPAQLLTPELFQKGTSRM